MDIPVDGMVDIHCHLLPGIDDGPDTLEQALELCRMAVSAGISHVVTTPHIHPGRYENDLKGINQVLQDFRAELLRHDIPLNLSAAAEVRIGPEILGMVADNRVPFLGEWQGKRVMLLELPHSQVPVGSDKLVRWLVQRNILPMIAHPERNKDVMRDLSKLHPFVEMGCLFQVTAGSVAGRFGEAAQERAHELLEKGWVTVLASDAHNAGPRPPLLTEGREAAAAIVGEARSWELVRDNPAEIVRSHFAGLV